jgi:hypothetical protein
MDPASNKKLRWEDYFLRSSDEFSKFWEEYLGNKERNVLFVVGMGFDPRMCAASEVILNRGGKGKRDCYLIVFDEGPDSPSRRYSEEIVTNRSKLTQIFNGKGDIIEKPVKIFSDDGRRIGSKSAANVFSSEDNLEKYTDIVVDISAIPLGLYFPIIKKLLHLYDSSKTHINNLNIHVVVAENPALDAAIQAEGVDDKANYIHGFGGRIDLVSTAQVPRIWMPILGERMEGQMTKIHTLISPVKDIFPVLPFPATNPRKGDDLILEYRQLLFDTLSVEPSNIVYAAEHNPFEAYRKIAKTAIQYEGALEPLGGCKIILSALSSKLLSIGALLAAYDLDQKKFSIGVAHVEAQGYIMMEREMKFDVGGKLFSLWLAGECYDAE